MCPAEYKALYAVKHKNINNKKVTSSVTVELIV